MNFEPMSIEELRDFIAHGGVSLQTREAARLELRRRLGGPSRAPETVNACRHWSRHGNPIRHRGCRDLPLDQCREGITT